MPEGLEGLRVDAAVSRLLGLSRSAVAALAADGAVRLDGRAAGKSDRVAAGAWLEVALPGEEPPPAPLRVAGMTLLLEDDDVVVVDKPVGVAAHPTPGWDGPTVVGGLAAAGVRVSSSGAAERQGVVHRLDVGTSGVMAVAKSERAYTSLKRQFRERTVDKRYRAVVQGLPDPPRGTVDAPLGRHPRHPSRFAVVADGRPSVTHYDTVEALRSASVLDVALETGRTHQIRVHLSALRHPCVGDALYGADPVLAARLGLGRQWLHAVALSFDHPAGGARTTVTSEPSEDLARALDLLRADA